MRFSSLFFLLIAVLGIQELRAMKPIQERQFVIDKVLRGHSAGVQNLRFSPDGKWLASSSLDKTIIIWDVETGILRHRLYGHQSTIYEVSFSNNGTLLASASEDGTVCVWDARYGNLLGKYENKALLLGNGLILRSVSFVTFSKDDKHIYFGGDNGYIMQARIDIPNQLATPIFSINLEKDLLSNTITGGTLAPSMDELIFSADHFVYAISLKNYKLIKRFHNPKADINDVVKGAKNSQITAWCYDGTIITWDYFTAQKLVVLQVSPDENYSAASFNKNGTLLATGADGKVAKIWDWTTKKELVQLGQHRNTVRVARFSPTEDIVATASLDGWVRIWKEKQDDPTTESEQLLATQEHTQVSLQSQDKTEQKSHESATNQIVTQIQPDQTSTQITNTNLIIAHTSNITTNNLLDKSACDTVFIEKEKIIYIRDTVVVRDTIFKKMVVRDTIEVVKTTDAVATPKNIVANQHIKPNQAETIQPDKQPQTQVVDEAKIDEHESEFESQFQVGKTLNLHTIQFRQGTATLLEESYQELEKLFMILKKYPSMKIRLDGHTDNVGVQTANLRLSGQRVRMVQDYLVRKGVERSRIQIRAYGGVYPIADNTTEEGKQKNRRVEVTVLEK